MNRNTIVSLIFAFVIGGFIGWLIWGGQQSTENTMTHQMSNGSTMTMDAMMQDMNAGLKDKEGDAFDKEFIKEMIVHHEGAVSMAKLVLQKSKRPELLKLANEIIAAQTGEISQMKKWQMEWFGN
ncbi:MAG: DUF305 domain-containing protein [Sphingobacteriales bacterium JAD_PAG50586_3]|nr:MAG: DUF305 domain-containing protein [Sphingobacteriales bacterium JAD_PAG50586_3]